jgi:hypothetical protein
MTTSVAAPAGWYPDVTRPGQERYWDGGQWTNKFRRLPHAPADTDLSKAEVKAACAAARAEANAAKQAAAIQAREAREEANRQTAFRATPVGQAMAAREQGQGFFEMQLVVGESQRDSTIFGGNNTNWAREKKVTHAGTLAAVEAVGWKLEHVGYIFQVTSESSRDKFLASGQQIAVSGRTVGIYLFRAVA